MFWKTKQSLRANVMKYEKGKSAGLADAHKALFHYDKNLEKYIKDNKKK